MHCIVYISALCVPTGKQRQEIQHECCYLWPGRDRKRLRRKDQWEEELVGSSKVFPLLSTL